ncbi:MAG: 30S ribosomal protein S5 [Minisyncoccia bacterium]
MTTENNNTNIAPSTPTPVASAVAPGIKPSSTGAGTFSRSPRPFGTFGRRPMGGSGDSRGPSNFDRSKNPRKSFSSREARVKPEFDQKILNIRRVTRVTSGGKRLSFSVWLVAGNRKGSVGIGTGKAIDTSLAIEKALRNAKKNMIKLDFVKNMSIPHIVRAKYCSATVSVMPTPGKGVTAGSAVKNVIELAGMNDVTAKIISSSKNKLNMARATIEALRVFTKKKNSSLTKPEEISKKEEIEEVNKS